MAFLSNKHVVASIIITPLLAILAYYLVDRLVREQPLAAEVGSSYALLAQSNCRYSSGQCDLHNAEFKVRVKIRAETGNKLLELQSSHALDGATIAFVVDGESTLPQKMRRLNNERKRWAMSFDARVDANTTMRLALSAQGSHYYASTGLAFSEYKTSFNKTF